MEKGRRSEFPKESGKDEFQLFLERVKKEGLKSFSLAELLKPNGYASLIAEKSELTRVQLRKIFAEFKQIYEHYHSQDKNLTAVKTRIYKLYPLIYYQYNRKLISEYFKDLIVAILDALDRDFEENIENAMSFVEALVAYAPKEYTRER
ncbi:MAG: type III-A CRISPR-associated protein Csm2 [Archaeoglobaceae archaeon]